MLRSIFGRNRGFGKKCLVVMVMKAKRQILLSSVSVYGCAISVVGGIVCVLRSIKTFRPVGQCFLCFPFFVACVSDQVRRGCFKMSNNPFDNLKSLYPKMQVNFVA